MSREKENSDKLKKFSQELGVSLFGIADVTGIRKEFYLDKGLASKFDWGISMGKRLVESVLDDIKDRPTQLYFHHYRQLNFFLDRASFLLSTYIQEFGHKALPIPASQVIDWEKHRGHLCHRTVGTLAGLGWRGRSNLLVNPEFGARFRLVTVLTDIPLVAAKPLETDCGECRACLIPCPAQAIKEKREDFDYMACYEKLQEFKRSGIVGQHICGVCVKYCPGLSKD
jgi:epoxyqueuosine reductase